jgi:hypothetical protein
MSQTGLTVPDMNEPLSRYNVTVTIGRDGGYLPDPAAFTAAADQATWSRSAAAARSYGVTTRKVRLGLRRCGLRAVGVSVP